ncbi:hypothetical protein C2G38_2184416 [Gigaspora rosea]|uniref:Uncharacterized protein n=1 Tax=Gigaspora rosea TaxID=44941 RepID=A0A397V7Y9_9GLOM|nr:hypothetical protein C2G38_2184416 [Gigaspora rosea]
MTTVGPCCKKEIEDEKNEIMKAKREERNDNKDEGDKTIVDEEDGEKEKNITKLTRKKDLDDACESQIKKVEKFKRINNLGKETKGPTEKEYAEIKEILNARKECTERVSTFVIVPCQIVKGAVKIEKKEAPTVCLVQFRIQKGHCNKNKKLRKLEKN